MALPWSQVELGLKTFGEEGEALPKLHRAWRRLGRRDGVEVSQDSGDNHSEHRLAHVLANTYSRPNTERNKVRPHLLGAFTALETFRPSVTTFPRNEPAFGLHFERFRENIRLAMK